MLAVQFQGQLGDAAFDVAFNAAVGITALFGPSGAGKTSVINAVAGLWTPAQGRISLGDQVWFDSGTGINVPTHRRRIGYVFQDARLFPHMTVARNLRYGGQHDAVRLIDVLGLAPLLDRMPKTLSGGEKQRVALGRALMRQPELVLMDEPLASLDGPRKAEILPYLERLRDTTELPILYVSHAMAEVTRLASNIVLIQNGRVMQSGPIETVLNDPAFANLLARQDRGALLSCTIVAHDTANQITELEFSGGTLSLAGITGPVGGALQLRVPAHDIILSQTRPTGISALNVIAVCITSLRADGAGGVAVGLQAGQDHLWAGITAKSSQILNLDVGQQIFAIVKATAVAPEIV